MLVQEESLDHPTKHHWTDDEREMVRRWYGKVDTRRLAASIGVSEKSVSLVAAYLALGKHRRQHHTWTEEELEVIRQDYTHTLASCQAIAHRLGVSQWAVRGQVSQMGIAKRSDYRRWTAAEDAQMAELVDQFSITRIARMLHRSVNAVRVRAQRLHLSLRTRTGWYTKTEVCEILGMGHRWVQRRIDNGTLRATWDHGKGAWHITESDVRWFLRRYCHELNGRNVDLVQVVNILAGLKNPTVREG